MTVGSYKGLTTVTPSSSGASIIIDNFKELADRAGPVTSAASAPGVGDDVADGYYKYSKWHHTGTNAIYMCADNTAGSAVWKNITASGAAGASTTTGLTDVNSGTPNDGDIFIFDSNGPSWSFGSMAAGASTTTGLTDVNNGPPNDGDFLTFDSAGPSWSPTAASDLSVGSAIQASLVQDITAHSLNNLADVYGYTPAAIGPGYALVWESPSWSPGNTIYSASYAGEVGTLGGNYLGELADVESAATPNDNDVLKWVSLSNSWSFGAVVAEMGSMHELTDVVSYSTTALSHGDALIWDSGSAAWSFLPQRMLSVSSAAYVMYINDHYTYELEDVTSNAPNSDKETLLWVGSPYYSWSPGFLSLGNLDNVDSNTPYEGDVLVFNSASNIWTFSGTVASAEHADSAGYASVAGEASGILGVGLSELADVDLGALSHGYVLSWNSSVNAWNATDTVYSAVYAGDVGDLSAHYIGELADVNGSVTPNPDDVLVYKSPVWSPMAAGDLSVYYAESAQYIVGDLFLKNLTDVDNYNPSFINNNDVLKWNSGSWSYGPVTAAMGSLKELQDAYNYAASDISDGYVLKWVASSNYWSPAANTAAMGPLNEAQDVFNYVASSINNNDVLKWKAANSSWSFGALVAEMGNTTELTDVYSNSPSFANQVLLWQGSSWSPGWPVMGDLQDLGDVHNYGPGSYPANNYVLKWISSGSSWSWGSVAGGDTPYLYELSDVNYGAVSNPSYSKVLIGVNGSWSAISASNMSVGSAYSAYWASYTQSATVAGAASYANDASRASYTILSNHNLSSMGDINNTSPNTGDVLKWTGVSWSPAAP